MTSPSIDASPKSLKGLMDLKDSTSGRYSQAPTRYADYVVDYGKFSAPFSAPAQLSQTAVQILATKYAYKAQVPSATIPDPCDTELPDCVLRRRVPAPDATFGAETSAKQIYTRLAAFWARAYYDQYGTTVAEAMRFFSHAMYLLENQFFAPNSPQWFNAGVFHCYGVRPTPRLFRPGQDGGAYPCDDAPQTSACFILSVVDDLCGPDGIMDLFGREAAIFKGGSGSGVNYSRIRGKGEKLSGGGRSSGLKSFLQVGDRAAGAIKSGGTTRRSARMVVVDADHPDIEEMIDWKVQEEDKVGFLVAGSKRIIALSNCLREAYVRFGKEDPRFDRSVRWAITQGLPARLAQRVVELLIQGARREFEEMTTGWEDEAYCSVSGQNANNSVRLSAKFMSQVASGGPWSLTERTTGNVTRTYPQASVLMDKIAAAAWACADPGVQFDDTINQWHVCPSSGKINATNPCVTGDTLVLCVGEDGEPCERRIDQMLDGPQTIIVDGAPRSIDPAFRTGHKPTLKIKYFGNNELRQITLTPDHLITAWYGSDATGAWVDMKAGDLRCGDVLCGDGDGRWRIVDIRDGGEHDVYDLTEPQTHHFIANGLRIHNCSEYCFLDDTACNLASINLVKFLLGEEAFDFDFDFEGFELVCRFVTTILELTIDASGYPSRELAANTGIFRTLGLGYMNLGSLLMRMGIPYGSSRALQVTRALTGLMTMEAWGQSARMAQIRGVFSGLGPDRPVLERVVGYHLAALIREGTPIDRSGVSFEGLTCPPERLGADTKNDKVTAPYIDRAAARAYVNYDLVKQHGARNAQVTVLAPTGTISFACDCDTTGIEPDFSLIKHKRLAGGGYLSYANTAVYPCLMALGFTESAAEDAVNYVLAKGTIYGFTHPALQPRTLQAALEALACAQSPDANTPTVSVKAHLEMLAAAQPVLSGAVSKTINMPPDTTIDDVRATYMEAYRLGLKAVAIYRAGCKFSEPMASGHGVWSSAEVEPVVLPDWIAQGYETAQAAPPARERLPSIRTSQTYSLSVGGLPFYLTTGEYADGRLGEIFITVADEGSALSGMARTLAKQTSLMLQHRVPLETVLHSLEGGSYDPAGFVTGGTNVRMASSLTDCIARHLRNVYLPAPDVVTAIAPGVNVDVVRARPSLDGQPRFTGARCSACNSLSLQRAGSCLVCQKCGTSTGCS